MFSRQQRERERVRERKRKRERERERKKERKRDIKEKRIPSFLFWLTAVYFFCEYYSVIQLGSTKEDIQIALKPLYIYRWFLCCFRISLPFVTNRKSELT